MHHSTLEPCLGAPPPQQQRRQPAVTVHHPTVPQPREALLRRSRLGWRRIARLIRCRSSRRRRRRALGRGPCRDSDTLSHRAPAAALVHAARHHPIMHHIRAHVRPARRRTKPLDDLDFNANTAINPATIDTLGRLRLDQQRPVAVLDRRLQHREEPPTDRPWAPPPPTKDTGPATSWPPNWSTNSSRPPKNAISPAPSPA